MYSTVWYVGVPNPLWNTIQCFYYVTIIFGDLLAKKFFIYGEDNGR